MSISKIFYPLIGDKSTSSESVEMFKVKNCSCCQPTDLHIKETEKRTFRILNLSNKRTYVKIDTFKVECQNCDAKTWLKLSFAGGKLPLLEINQPLSIAHSMKEQFRAFWNCSSRKEGVRFLALWVITAKLKYSKDRHMGFEIRSILS